MHSYKRCNYKKAFHTQLRSLLLIKTVSEPPFKMIAKKSKVNTLLFFVFNEYPSRVRYLVSSYKSRYRLQLPISRNRPLFPCISQPKHEKPEVMPLFSHKERNKRF